ncbi:DDE superfamily endonuclease [Phytophthora infestans]|uniref:DDE superfamily endonuclease n=1 Tax=Phytophthora infestans TaxID=4787 RepID=A0A8S9V7Q7_PHYIN|nr:DDE superfamily endonuclease [Phytophthora infestans]
MSKTRHTYSTDTKTAIVAKILSGAAVPEVAAQTKILERTIRKWVTKSKKEQSLEPRRRGPNPHLPPEAERHLFEWVAGQQIVGYPVDRTVILKKAQEISLLITGQSVGAGWYQRFMGRNLELTPRVAQALTGKRNCVSAGSLRTLFNTLAKLVVELRLDSSRIFNTDETAFQRRKKSKRAIAVRGSTNVWCLDPSVNFLLSIVACGSAADFVIPPAYILPGKTVEWDVIDECSVSSAAITISPSGFINTYLYELWLHVIDSSVPRTVKRPLLLVLDGCSSYYSGDVLETATRLEILLVLLPPNATHLLRPLDVAVFATLKVKLCNLIKEVVDVDDEGCDWIDKPNAIKLANMAWATSKIGRNLKAGFKACGIFPLSLVCMHERFGLYDRRAPRHSRLAAWLHVKPTVEKEVLQLGEKQKKSSKRNRVTVGGRLLTQEILQGFFFRKQQSTY